MAIDVDYDTAWRLLEHGWTAPDLAGQIAALLKAEREACAKLAESIDGDFERDTESRTVSATRAGIASAIRARSNESI